MNIFLLWKRQIIYLKIDLKGFQSKSQFITFAVVDFQFIIWPPNGLCMFEKQTTISKPNELFFNQWLTMNSEKSTWWNCREKLIPKQTSLTGSLRSWTGSRSSWSQAWSLSPVPPSGWGNRTPKIGATSNHKEYHMVGSCEKSYTLIVVWTVWILTPWCWKYKVTNILATKM